MHVYFKLYLLLYSTNTKAFVTGGILISAFTDNVLFVFNSLDFAQVLFSTIVFSAKCVLGGLFNYGVKKMVDNKIFKGGNNEQH
jgi:membrane protein YqaA with SNARE-associated domain